MKITVQLLVGGTSVENNKKDLIENTPHIVVGTPGRIHDMLRRKYLNANNFKVLVIDEADEMFHLDLKNKCIKSFNLFLITCKLAYLVLLCLVIYRN